MIYLPKVNDEVFIWWGLLEEDLSKRPHKKSQVLLSWQSILKKNGLLHSEQIPVFPLCWLFIYSNCNFKWPISSIW